MPTTTLIHDSDCGSAAGCWRRCSPGTGGGALRPVALETEDADRLLAGMPNLRQMASWHLVDPDGRSAGAGSRTPAIPAKPPLSLGQRGHQPRSPSSAEMRFESATLHGKR
jgi:hypothetical protein